MKMRYPCKNKELGCTSLLPFKERDEHEKKCCFKAFKCAMEKCSWIGRLEDLPAHWASKKTSSKAYHSNNICHTRLKNESYYVNIMEAFGHYFWFKCKLTKKRIYWAVQFIGDSNEAENFFYDIEVFKPGRTKKKILLSDYCQSIELENSQLFTETACISVSTDNFDNFVGEEQLLVYYMRVHPVKSINQQNTNDNPSSSTQGTNTPKKTRDRSKGPSKMNYKSKKPGGKPKTTTSDENDDTFSLFM